jgi:hypothetical protein
MLGLNPTDVVKRELLSGRKTNDEKQTKERKGHVVGAINLQRPWNQSSKKAELKEAEVMRRSKARDL